MIGWINPHAGSNVAKFSDFGIVDVYQLSGVRIVVKVAIKHQAMRPEIGPGSHPASADNGGRMEQRDLRKSFSVEEGIIDPTLTDFNHTSDFALVKSRMGSIN